MISRNNNWKLQKREKYKKGNCIKLNIFNILSKNQLLINDEQIQ